MIIYEDLYTFRELYCKYSKEALEKNNDIVLVATTYEAPHNIRDMLSDYEVNVKYHESNGSLIIIDSVQGYQMGDIYGLLRLIQLLGIRAQKQCQKRHLLHIGHGFIFLI